MIFCFCFFSWTAVSSPNPDPVWRPELAVDYQYQCSINMITMLWPRCKIIYIFSWSIYSMQSAQKWLLVEHARQCLLTTITISHHGTLDSPSGSKLCSAAVPGSFDSTSLQKRRLCKLPSAAGVCDREPWRPLRGEPEQPRGLLGRPGQKPAALVQGV